MIEKSKDSKSFFNRDPCNIKLGDKKYTQFDSEKGAPSGFMEEARN